jgi:hypothetical protein
VKDWKQKRSRADDLKEDGVWFTDEEFAVAAEIYDTPIIIFSDIHVMAFFDCLFDAVTEEGKKKDPLYIYHNGNHFTVLVHKD